VLAGSAVVRLPRSDATVVDDPGSHDGLPALVWSRRLCEGHDRRARLTVVDGTPDGRSAYDRLLVDRAAPAAVARGEWFRLDGPQLVSTAPATTAVWCRLLDLHPDLGAARVYVGALETIEVEPHAAAQLIGRLGPWPGTPDGHTLADGWIEPLHGIDPDTYLDQAERVSAFIERAAARLAAQWPVEVLLVGDPAVDGYRRGATITDPEQWGYSPGAEVAARRGLKRLGALVGAGLQRWLERARGAGAALLVVSPYELAPVHTAVRLPRWMSDHGLATAKHGPVRVLCSGGTARLELGPDVAEDRARSLLLRAAHVLADLEVRGRPVVEEIESTAPPRRVLIRLAPGHTASCSASRPVLVPTRTTAATGLGGCGILLGSPSAAMRRAPATAEALWRALARGDRADRN
jgi:hypothetical protein